MAGQEKGKLIAHAVKLYTLGLRVEHERRVLRRLVKHSVPYDCVLMQEAVTAFQTAEAQWKRLESEHLHRRTLWR